MKESKGYALTSFGMYAETFGTLRASGGDRGGGSEVLIVYGFDSYNQATEEEMAQPLRSHGGGRYNAQSNRVP